MIRVIRIAGESFDLVSGEQLPKALILSNGVREYPLYVDDETAHFVLQMMVEPSSAGDSVGTDRADRDSPAHAPLESPLFKTDEEGRTVVPEGRHGYAVLEDSEPEPVASVVDLPEELEEPVLDDEDYEPGEEYSDPATGVGSL